MLAGFQEARFQFTCIDVASKGETCGTHEGGDVVDSESVDIAKSPVRIRLLQSLRAVEPAQIAIECPERQARRGQTSKR